MKCPESRCLPVCRWPSSFIAACLALLIAATGCGTDKANERGPNKEHEAEAPTESTDHAHPEHAKVVADSTSAFIGPLYHDTLDAIDYSDPTLGGVIPLMRVAGRENMALSENLQLGDFAASDGAAYARVSNRIVGALEQIMSKVAGPINISSGYRHRALNGRSDIGGAAQSMHMAGMAADVWSYSLTPLQLASAILDTVGCRVGIGLGRTFVHLDVRGYLASWAGSDAQITEEEFDRFVQYKCTNKDRGSTPSAEILAILNRMDGLPAGADAQDEVPSAFDYRDVLSAYARVQLRQGRQGAVVLDFRTDTLAGEEEAYPYVVGFVASGTKAARLLGVQPMITSARPGYFAFVLLHRRGMAEVGMMSLENRQENHSAPKGPSS